MVQDPESTGQTRGKDQTLDEIQQIWLSNELIERVKEVAHDIDERVQHVLKIPESPQSQLECQKPESPMKKSQSFTRDSGSCSSSQG